MTLDGPNIATQGNNFNQEALSIALLLQYNVSQRRRGCKERYYLSYKKPLPVYIRMMRYAKTRKPSTTD